MFCADVNALLSSHVVLRHGSLSTICISFLHVEKLEAAVIYLLGCIFMTG